MCVYTHTVLCPHPNLYDGLWTSHFSSHLNFLPSNDRCEDPTKWCSHGNPNRGPQLGWGYFVPGLASGSRGRTERASSGLCKEGLCNSSSFTDLPRLSLLPYANAFYIWYIDSGRHIHTNTSTQCTNEYTEGIGHMRSIQWISTCIYPVIQIDGFKYLFVCLGPIQ